MQNNPPALYNVSAKAIISNSLGHVLLVKEHSNNWSLPGGGIDQGEDPIEALHRELFEELGVRDAKILELESAYSYFAPIKGVWRMWLLYKVELDTEALKPGEHTTEVAFIDINSFKGSENYAEKRIYASVMKGRIK